MSRRASYQGAARKTATPLYLYRELHGASSDNIPAKAARDAHGRFFQQTVARGCRLLSRSLPTGYSRQRRPRKSLPLVLVSVRPFVVGNAADNSPSQRRSRQEKSKSRARHGQVNGLLLERANRDSRRGREEAIAIRESGFFAPSGLTGVP
jgi:hypothetical protein